MNTKNLKTIALAAVAGLALGFAPCANAEPTLTDVKAQTHYPWDGKVDLSYTTQGVRDEMIARGLELSLRVLAIDETTHITNTATPAALSGDMTFADGTHAFVWDMDKQGLKEINSSNVVFKVTCMAADGDDYKSLQNKPSINGTTLDGNKSLADLGISGTTVMLNGASKAGAGATIFAPTTGGTARDILTSGGANASPEWKGLETATVTYDSKTGGKMVVCKIGRFCSVYFDQIRTSGGGGGTSQLIATIDNLDYMPTSSWFCLPLIPNNGREDAAWCQVVQEGSKTKFYMKGHNANCWYYGSGFYIVQ